MRPFLSERLSSARAFILLAAILIIITPAAAQKKNKTQQQQDADSAAASAAASQEIRAQLPDSELIDQTISDVLGYWQIGDVESMSKYYAKDVVIVSNAWDKPLMGWDSYAKMYTAQRAHLANLHLDRINTYIKANGDSAWATYQWEYKGSIDGQPFDSLGHTTLVLNKQNGQWVIAVDHSSAVSDLGPAAAAASAAPAQTSSVKNP